MTLDSNAIGTKEITLPARFGPFVLLRQLGVGGMGVAYLAVELATEKLLVVKRLHPELLRDATIGKRFIHEARVAEHVRHPNVAAPVSMGTIDDEPFLATEFVFGLAASELIDLAEARDIGPIPLGVALSIAVGIASGLEAIHGARHIETGAPLGLLHRDLGARNVLLGFDGSPRIIDLGLGKSVLANWQTGAHVLAGSPDYMSPEQAAGATVDPRSDVYSAAVSIWELFAGRKRIREATTPARLARALLAQPEPLRRHRPDAPEALEVALMSAMAHDPDRRTKGARGLKTELMRVWASTGSDASPIEVVAWLDAALASVRRREELRFEEAQASARFEVRTQRVVAVAGAISALNFRSPYDFYGAVDESSSPHPALEHTPPDFIERITRDVRARFGKRADDIEAGQTSFLPAFLRRIGDRLRTALSLLALSSLAGLGTAAALSMQATAERAPPETQAEATGSPRIARAAPAPTDEAEPVAISRDSTREIVSARKSSGPEDPELSARKRSLLDRIRRARHLRVDVGFQRRVTRISSELRRAKTPEVLDVLEVRLTELESEG